MNALKDQIDTKTPIIINGVKVGYIEPALGHAWHAAIEVDPGTYRHRLAQGFGDTHEEAIADAFKSGHDEAIEFLGLLTVLKAGYESQEHESLANEQAAADMEDQRQARGNA